MSPAKSSAERGLAVHGGEIIEATTTCPFDNTCRIQSGMNDITKSVRPDAIPAHPLITARLLDFFLGTSATRSYA